MSVPYYAPEKPLIPNAQENIAPSIIHAGVMMLAQQAEAKNKLDFDTQKLATDAALRQKEYAIEREHNYLEYSVGIANAHRYSDAQKAAAAAKDQEDQNIFTRLTRIQMAKADYIQRKQELDVGNPAPDDIRTFVGNSLQLAHEFKNYDIPDVKSDLANVVTRAKNIQGQIPLPYGAYPEYNDKGQLQWKGGKTKIFTPAEIVSGLANPATQQPMANALEASGLMKGSPHTFTAAERGTNAEGPDVQGTLADAPTYLRDWVNGVPTPTGTPRPSISSRMPLWEAKRTPADAPETVPGQPSITQESVDEVAAAPATTASPSAAPAPNVFDTSKTDKLKQSYLRHANEPGFNKDAAKAFLVQNGVDVTDLP